ncbi:acyl-CoA thioesterase [Cellulomonas timonensis]|uniref:acyl-CoA thioesterase n=1 Tax=Cellulomonas timonensis TaxID=1689271 RepID=UPI00082E2760|nr:thioesterase family protein [Cellulomonas timonensis]
MTRLDVPVSLRWSDLDAYGHVNNVAMLTLLEEARIEVFWRHPAAADDSAVAGWPTAVIDAGPGAQTSTLVAGQQVEYLRPLAYRRHPVVVVMWIGHLGGASLDICYEVRDSPSGVEGETYARAITTLVLVDSATGAPRRIGPAERAAWEPFVEAPLELRRRR